MLLSCQSEALRRKGDMWMQVYSCDCDCKDSGFSGDSCHLFIYLKRIWTICNNLNHYDLNIDSILLICDRYLVHVTKRERQRNRNNNRNKDIVNINWIKMVKMRKKWKKCEQD